MTKPLAEQTPAEVDTILAGLWVEAYKAQGPVERARSDIYRQGGAKKAYGRGPARWSMTFEEALAKVQQRATDESLPSYERDGAQRALDYYEKAMAKVAEVEAQIAEIEEEFERRGGWSRVWLVQNASGHAHSSRACSTCYPTTQFALLPAYSGLPEAEIVEAAGNRACTVCYPTAPVDRPTQMYGPDEIKAAQEREQREAEKARKAAEKVAKALTADGSEFMVSWPGYREGSTSTESFKTERAAMQWAVEKVAWHNGTVGHGHEDYTPAIEAILAAVAAKHGQPLEQVRAEFEKKVAAKRKRDGMA